MRAGTTLILLCAFFSHTASAQTQDVRDAARIEANRIFISSVEEAKNLASQKDSDRMMIEAAARRNQTIQNLRELSKSSWLDVEKDRSSAKEMEWPEFEHYYNQSRSIVDFLAGNRTSSGLPLSYRVPKGYWKNIKSDPVNLDELIERILAGEEGQDYSGALNLYDGGLWQIAMALEGRIDLADEQTQRLLSNQSGGLSNIRGWEEPFFYGESRKKMSSENALFFRMITDTFTMVDPLDGKAAFQGFPTMDLIHHVDWKPVLGENVWAAIIGPLQTAYIKNNGTISLDSSEMKLARSILPSILAMQSSIGAVYHVPYGTHGKHPRSISNENNFSLYASLKMLKQALSPYPDDENVQKDLQEIDRILNGLEKYFKKYSFNADEGVFFQGGYWIDNQYIANADFAVDCQTWGIAILGAGWINQELGKGDESTAFQIWQKTKQRAGYYKEGLLRGVGFTEDHDILSSEWTFGAILMAREMAGYYQAKFSETRNQEFKEWARVLERDARNMRLGIESLKVTFPDGSAAYNYANKRYYIIFEWWANPVPSITSAWALFLDQPFKGSYFNPFILGGGPSFKK